MFRIRTIAKFDKVSYEQFFDDFTKTFNMIQDTMTTEDYELVSNSVRKVYDSIKLPKRATMGSAGYDFFVPIDLKIVPNTTVKIPTGVRCKMEDDWVLKLYPRSGLGFKYRLQLNNTVGIIDSDYFYADNEGHIMAKITNDTNEEKTVTLEVGNGFMQGIFVQYGITEDDHVETTRNGGFGSTDKK